MTVLHNKIGLGSVQFGVDYGISNKRGKTPFEEVDKMLQYALNNGIQYIDTASAYGNAEEVLGNCNLKDFKVISKFMPPDIKSLEQGVDNSLAKLNLEKLYGYLAHRPETLIKDRSQWARLVDLKDKAKVEKIGFSLNHPDELERLLQLGLIPDLIQVPFNLFDNRFEKLMIQLKKNGCEVHVRSTFLQGLFFMNPNVLPLHFNQVKGLLSQLQIKHGEKLSGTLLKFVLEKDFIDTVIIGVENLNQLVQNFENLKSSKPIGIDIPIISNHILVPSEWPKS